MICFLVTCLWLLLDSACVHSKRDCKDGIPVEPYPSTVVNTTIHLMNLRAQMVKYGLHAYYIPSADDHQTEYVAAWFLRRSFISGASGSAGTAVVTLSSAAIWVDGRYYDEVEMQVDCNWIVQKAGMPDVPNVQNWIKQVLRAGDQFGVDPKVISLETWERFSESLQDSGIRLQAVQENLVDQIWDDRPVPTKNALFTQPLKYSGQNHTEKIKNLQEELKAHNVKAIVLSALDDIAWLLNLRGNDISYNPFFYGYVVVTLENATLFVDKDKMSQTVVDAICPAIAGAFCVSVQDYNYTLLQGTINGLVNGDARKIWIPRSSSYFIVQDIPKERRYIANSPVQLPKAAKNKVELEGMKIANIRDGIAIMEFLLWLEQMVHRKAFVTEISASEKLIEFKKLQQNFVGLSFGTIAGYGPNAAIIHYRATNLTDRMITDDSVFLLDSGAQFPEGSTDITRTVHFGRPSAYMKETYTYVLKGAINLASAVFPLGTYGSNVDALARQYMWSQGLNYNHGTGHGIGSFLSIHEGPGRIAGGKVSEHEEYMREGFVFSDEPGYYEPGKFGIRLETDMYVTKAETKYHFGTKPYLKFEMLTLVPFDKKLINYDMLTPGEIDWLNSYNQKIRDVVGPELLRQQRHNVHKYMMDLTEKISFGSHCSTASPLRLDWGNFMSILFAMLGVTAFF